jgi:hypothetical protein
VNLSPPFGGSEDCFESLTHWLAPVATGPPPLRGEMRVRHELFPAEEISELVSMRVEHWP